MFGVKQKCEFVVAPERFEPGLCDDEATHEWHDGGHLCERHYNYLVEYWKEKRRLAELEAKENPPPIEFCHIDCTTRGGTSVVKPRRLSDLADVIGRG
jgi:hypothetical protein